MVHSSVGCGLLSGPPRHCPVPSGMPGAVVTFLLQRSYGCHGVRRAAVDLLDTHGFWLSRPEIRKHLVLERKAGALTALADHPDNHQQHLDPRPIGRLSMVRPSTDDEKPHHDALARAIKDGFEEVVLPAMPVAVYERWKNDDGVVDVITIIGIRNARAARWQIEDYHATANGPIWSDEGSVAEVVDRILSHFTV